MRLDGVKAAVEKFHATHTGETPAFTVVKGIDGPHVLSTFRLASNDVVRGLDRVDR
jgi:hypothetical protein